KKLDNIYSVITVSKLTSIIDISRTLALNSEETRTLIKKLIEEAKDNKDYRLLKNAYIDYRHDKVVLDPNAGNNTFTRAVDSVMGSLFPKKESKIDWTCTYCNTLNRARLYNCHNCGAGKTGE